MLSICLFVSLFVCRQNAKNAIFSKTKQFRAMMSIKKLCNWAFQRTHYWITKTQDAEIRHLENRHDVIFSAEGGPIWIKISQTGTE